MDAEVCERHLGRMITVYKAAMTRPLERHGWGGIWAENRPI